MSFDRFTKKSSPQRKKDRVYIFSKDNNRFSEVVEALSVYGIKTEIKYLLPSESLEILNEGNFRKAWFLIDSTCYKEQDIVEFAMILRGRFRAALLGTVNALEAVWKATELGYTDYFLAESDSKRMVSNILQDIGYLRSRTSMVIGICNTSPDINLSYQVFDDLQESQTLRSYSSLFVNCDTTNIYYDARMGIRTDKQVIDHILNKNDELDSVSSRKLISSFEGHFDYISFNLLTNDVTPKDFERLNQGIDAFIDSVSDSYGFIIVNIPYYFLISDSGIELLNHCDIRVLLTNGQIESIYNLNFLKDKIAFKDSNDSKNRDKLICLRQDAGLSDLRITDREIKSKLGIVVDHSSQRGKKNDGFPFIGKKKTDNVFDMIFR